MLRRIRERRGMTQDELAKKVGVTRITITRIETSARNPSMALVQKLAKALKVKLAELLK